MSLFRSLNWFKSKKREELEELQLKKARLDVQLLESDIQWIEEAKKPPLALPAPDKLYKKLKMVDGLLTIVLHGGEILKKYNATKEDFIKAKEAKSEIELINLTSSEEGLLDRKKHEEEVEKKKSLLKGIELLENLADFELRDGSVYLKSENGETIERSLPQLLVERFIEVVGKYDYSYEEGILETEALAEDVEYQSLKKFWLKCCLNPNARSSEDLYEFLKYHNMKIDKHGNFYTYRRVDSKEGTNRELVDFISNAYNKVKAVWKKNAKNYWVHLDEENNVYSFDTKEFSTFNDLGNLKELYENLPNMKENGYTSRHTGLEDYKVGEVISMPRYEGDDNNKKNCSKGFHQASKMYDYSGFGNTPILAIVNPIDVLAVPLNEVGKLRVCRWFFAMTLPEEEKYILDDDDFDVTDLGDIFEEKCSEDLQNYVQNSIAQEVQRHTFTIPEISASEINTIVSSLESMKGILRNRVSLVEDDNEESEF